MRSAKRMTVTVPVEIAATIRQAVERGEYESPGEVVREALREWKARRWLVLNEFSTLKADIDRGLADATAGCVQAFDTDRIVERGRLLLAARYS